MTVLSVGMNVDHFGFEVRLNCNSKCIVCVCVRSSAQHESAADSKVRLAGRRISNQIRNSRRVLSDC